eukprot:4295061-Karenia_brevis.AAC.1
MARHGRRYDERQIILAEKLVGISVLARFLCKHWILIPCACSICLGTIISIKRTILSKAGCASGT